MAELVIDQIEGAELVLDTNADSRRVRMATVTGIDVTGEADANVLEKALTVTGMPGIGEPMPGNTAFTLQQVAVVGLFHNACRVRLTYRPFQFVGLPANAYIITDGGALSQELTSIHAGTGHPIRVGFNDPLHPDLIVKPQTVVQSVPWPLRKVRLQSIIQGVPDGAKNYMGYVNLTSWPTGFSPLGKGFWLIDGFETTYSRYQGYYQIIASAVARPWGNWMIQSIANDQFGKPVPIDPDTVAAMMALEYVRGIATPVNGGMVSVGHFPLVEFSTVFGF